MHTVAEKEELFISSKARKGQSQYSYMEIQSLTLMVFLSYINRLSSIKTLKLPIMYRYSHPMECFVSERYSKSDLP